MEYAIFFTEYLQIFGAFFVILLFLLYICVQILTIQINSNNKTAVLFHLDVRDLLKEIEIQMILQTYGYFKICTTA